MVNINLLKRMSRAGKAEVLLVVITVELTVKQIIFWGLQCEFLVVNDDVWTMKLVPAI
jgi:hypothetical protein